MGRKAKTSNEYDFGVEYTPESNSVDDYDFGLDTPILGADFSELGDFEIDQDDGALDFGEDPYVREMLPEEIINISPQEGPQTEFLSTKADIAIYGGGAGGGKTFGILLDPLRHIENPLFGGVIFRRNSKQVRNQGGLWDESMKLYAPLGGEPRTGTLDWTFPEGMRIGFAHLEYDANVHDWHGSQIPFIGFDELTHFTRYQFFYMLSRNRSDSGVPGYIRATCNPDADSWVREFIDWWIDDEGWAIPERAGKLRWFIVVDDTLMWANSKEELISTFGEDLGQFAVSVTFIPATINDNKKLLEKDPTYLARLKALPMVERMRLLGDARGGNWNIRHSAGTMFREEWFEIIDAVPAGFSSVIRFWDRAATPVSPSNPDPDWTRGILVYKYDDGTIVIGDLKSCRESPGGVETLIKNVASHDGPSVMIMSQTDPGSAGKTEAMHFTRMLQGYVVYTEPMHTNKVARAKPVSAQVQAGNVKVVRATWNKEFFSELQSFPDGVHDDCVDVLSGAYNKLTQSASILDNI